jgi:hypothetical protein
VRRHRRRIVACCAASALIVLTAAAATSASAAVTVHGRILGRPAVSSVHARVPVLLDDGRQLVLRVPARTGFRTPDRGRTRPDRTRLGDAITARVRTLRGGRASAAYLRIDRRSAAPPFGELAEGLKRSSDGVRRAGDEVTRLATTTPAPGTTPPDPGPLRLFLLQVRYSLNLLIADLRDQAGGMTKVADDVKALPRAEALGRRLRRAGHAARTAAQRLEDGVTGLDEVINSIGGLSGSSLPVGTTSAVGQAVALLEQLLDGLDPQDALPGQPKLPDPLGGVPVPAAPPVLPG